MIIQIILLALGIIAASLFIVSKVVNYSFKTIVLKGVASLFFVALGIVCFCLNFEGYFFFKLFTVIGLFFGFLGDVFLGFKYVNEKNKKMWILFGLFAFAIGHILYFSGLFIDFYEPGNALPFVLSFGTPFITILIYLVISRKLGIHFEKKMLIFILFYLYCLFAMLSTSLYIGFLHGFSKVMLIMFFIGAVFFATSDFMLAGSYFKDGERPKAYNAIYSIFYYAAQFIIAFSIFFLV